VSSIPGKDIPPLFKYQDVAFHFLEYCGLAVLLNRALKDIRGWSSFSLAVLLCLLYAASDEWHQSFVPGRTASLYDVGVDGIGALAASVFYLWRR